MLFIDSSILKALEKIEGNNKGFVIVVDNQNVVKGTLTDGDIRRSLLNGKNLDTPVSEIVSRNYSFLNEYDSFDRLINFFKTSKINFLPIINKNKQLINVLTKAQLHTALLEGIEWDYNYDFTLLDAHSIEHEIYNRPWGYFKTVFLSEYSRAKIIQVNPQEVLSLQEHKKREEHWVIIKGRGIMTLGESEKDVAEGVYIYIPKGCKHRIINTSINEPLIISEVQLGDYFGEDDIIRYEDKYGRNKSIIW